jgi:uronate dehydrogenase
MYPVGVALDGSERARPDGLYGASKVYGEALGSMYADRFGLSVVCLRIGSFQPRPRERRELSA